VHGVGGAAAITLEAPARMRALLQLACWRMQRLLAVANASAA
jgi:hypothetical protein